MPGEIELLKQIFSYGQTVHFLGPRIKTTFSVPNLEMADLTDKMYSVLCLSQTTRENIRYLHVFGEVGEGGGGGYTLHTSPLHEKPVLPIETRKTSVSLQIHMITNTQ